jgi:hypothetical protein
MPRGDGTGPFGQGPMTGRGAGYCVGSGYVGAANWCGGGRGYRNRFCATGVPFRGSDPSPEPTLDLQQEVALLKSEAERLRSLVESIGQRLEKLATT